MTQLVRIVTFIKKIPSIIWFAVATLASLLLTDTNNNIFFGISLFCIIGLIINIAILINKTFSRYNKSITWTICFGLICLLFYISKFLKENSWSLFFLVLILISLVLDFLAISTAYIFGLIKKQKWKLLHPLYLFPLKLLTYSLFYFIKFTINISIELFKLIIEYIAFPFKSTKNFIKSIFIVGISVYLIASVFVITDYLRTHYGYYGKFMCSYGTSEKLKKKVVRIVGAYGEGTGFFIAENQVLTNFHVIDGEPSPKIIFPDGTFITPVKITGDKKIDLAVLFTQKEYPNMLMPLSHAINLKNEETLIATGYPMGTDIKGKATALKGTFIDYRSVKGKSANYIQTDINLVEGMSGGPLTDQCGKVVGINTLGLSGLSLFIAGDQAKSIIPNFTDQEIVKIKVDPGKSPQDAVIAFYTYLKARRMEDGFKLLSKKYLEKTNFEEWTNRFKDVLDVDIFKTEIKNKKIDNEVFVKFTTQNWVNEEIEFHDYEGTWQTVFEDGVYKMLKSNIKEVIDPGWQWYYE